MFNMSIYFLNIDLGLQCTGIENSALLRAKLFYKELNINPIFILSKYSPHQYLEILSLKENGRLQPDTKTVNIYDLVQSVDRNLLAYKEKSVFIDKGFSVVKVNENKKIIDSSGYVVMYLVYNKFSGLLSYINRFDQRKIWRRDYYDCLGFLSRTQILREEDRKVSQEIYYRPNGTISLIKDFFYSFKDKLEKVRFQVVSNVGEFVCVFYNENDFIYYFLSLYFDGKKENKVLLVDKNKVFYDVAVKLKESLKDKEDKTYIISAIHNLHVVNYKEKNSSRINSNYFSVFKDLTKTDAVIVQTLLQKEDILDRFQARNIYAIPHTYENRLPKEFNLKRNLYKAVYFARYSIEKRHELAIHAFEKVVEEIPSATFHCYGFGAELAELKKLVVELKLENNIFLHGWCNNVAEEYESAGLSIISSQSESFSLTIAESLAHGCPVVCFDVPYGPRELVQSGENGYLVPYPDTQAMAEKVIYIMTESTRQLELSKKARISSRKYSEAVVAKQWSEVLSRLGN